MNNYGRLAILLCAGLCGCSSLLTQAELKPITLDALRKIQPGITPANDVKELLGAPAEITKLVQKSIRDTGEVWEYFENGATRVSITMGKDGLVTFWGLHVYEQDPEQQLGKALSRFSEAKWKVESTKWVNPHSWPNECYFTDPNRGITIEFNRARKEVAMIESWDPSRQLASSESEKPPTYCIDGACSPASSYKEVFGDKSLCELPR